MAASLHRIASYIDQDSDAARYGKIRDAIVRNVDDLHWSPKDKTYCDATVDAYEESVHVCHKGYISLFPLMTGLLSPTHPHLSHVLDLLSDENELWSPHGIRSLSARSEFYGTEENYWRSPIWLNMNYLILVQLHSLGRARGPERARAGMLYNALRVNLVETVMKGWRETGFAWEQYDPDTGRGQRTQHFTGWTSLVVKVMGMEGLVEEEEAGRGRDEL